MMEGQSLAVRHSSFQHHMTNGGALRVICAIAEERGSQIANHVVSAHFVGTSHERSKQWYIKMGDHERSKSRASRLLFSTFLARTYCRCIWDQKSFEVFSQTSPIRCAVRSLPVRVCHVTSVVCNHNNTARQILLFNDTVICWAYTASVTNKWMSTGHLWNDTDRKNPDARRKTGPSAMLSTINPIYTGAESNPCPAHHVLRLLCCHTTGPFAVFRPTLDFLRHGSNNSLVPVDTHPAQCVQQHSIML